MPGHTKPAYIVPCDHQASFERGVFFRSGTLGADQTGRITAVKRLISDGFTAAVADGVSMGMFILVDEQLGQSVE